MDFTQKSRQRIVCKVKYEDLEKKCAQNVTLYRTPPTENISLEEFEDLAIERIKLLRILEKASEKFVCLLSKPWKEYVNTELSREGLEKYLRLCTGKNTPSTSDLTAKEEAEADFQARRRDYISHFILRLVYCRTAEQRRWFIMRELELFRYRFAALNGEQVREFLNHHNLDYKPISAEEKEAVKDGLYQSTMGPSVTRIATLDFYKVRFTEVLDLVRSRRCYLKKGFAYVNADDFGSIVATIHLDEIENGLHCVKESLPEIELDDRICHILKSLNPMHTTKGHVPGNGGCVPIEALDELAQKSYPLCMRACHEHIRAKHHIKDDGRLQYGLFLKGIGVTVHDSVRFWKEEFTKITPEFNKLEYDILCNYGLRGSMIDRTPFSCVTIINSNLQLDTINGCPYKIFQPSTLKAKLLKYGLSTGQADMVVDFAAKGRYKAACRAFFQITHNTTAEIDVNNPNQYFDRSQKLLAIEAKQDDDKEDDKEDDESPGVGLSD